MPRWVLHVDLDQFIAAVEVLRHPELRGRPVVVGGDGDPTKRGVVSTASYEARPYGVHSGLALRTAARRCPDAVFLPVDRGAYEAASAEVMAAIRQLHAVVEVLGWDEAFVRIDTPDPESVAREIQRQVLAATGLHCTVGIGENRLQAKLATGFGKPAGVFRLTSQNWYDLLGDRPPDALWGIGAKTARRLADQGFHTVDDLAAADPDVLAATVGPVAGPWLVRLGRGEDRSPMTGAPRVPRSRGHETTYQHDTDDWGFVQSEVRRLAGLVAADVTREQLPATRVVVKVRYARFFTQTHAQRLDQASSDKTNLEQAALAALDRFPRNRPVRLVGVRAELDRLRPDPDPARGHESTFMRRADARW